MILDRPLENVPARALYALHRGIEKQTGLITMALVDNSGRVCATGSLSRNGLFGKGLICVLNELGLVDSNIYYRDSCRCMVEGLNDGFKGTPEERREFMLRHIVNELRERGKSIDGKAAEKELSQVSI